MARRKVKMPYFSARLDFPSPSLSAPGSPRMHSGGLVALGTKVKGSGEKTIIKQKKQWTLALA